MVGQRSREIGQESVKGAKPVTGHSVHYALKIAVSIAVEAHFFGLLFICEGLQRACAVEAAVGAVGRAGKSVHAATPRGTGRFVSLIKMSKV